MRDKILAHFKKYLARAKVARKLLDYGLRVEKGNIYCGEIKISKLGIAKSAGVNIKSVDVTIKMIEEDPYLQKIFSKIKPKCDLKSLASLIDNWNVLEIYVDDPHRPGILAPIAKLIAEEGVSIAEVIIEEKDEKNCAYIITENPLSPATIKKIAKLDGVKEVHHLYL